MENMNDIFVREVVSAVQVYSPCQMYQNVKRPCSALVWKPTGTSTYYDSGVSYKSDPFHIIYIPRGASYCYTVGEKGSCYIIDFNGSGLPGHICSFYVSDLEETLKLFSNSEKEWSLKNPGYREACFSNIYSLLKLIKKSYKAYRDPRREKIRKSLDYMEKNYQSHDFNISSMATCSNVSEAYFRRLFKNIMGISPKRYVIKLRINKARELLKMQELSVNQISEDVGFADVFSFCKSFKKEEGYTPTEFRNLYLQQNRFEQ